MQGELAVKNVELATASQEAEKLLKDISENTAIAEVEKGKVAVIVDQVSTTAAVRDLCPSQYLRPFTGLLTDAMLSPRCPDKISTI